MKKMIVASTSTVYGSSYLEYLMSELKAFFKPVNKILFIPYARPGGIDYDEYTKLVAKAFGKINIEIAGIHKFSDQKKAIENAEAIFTGGGNTFVLVAELYKKGLMNILSDKIEKGTYYLGTSAGSNICGLTMQTTNDMPIVYPPSYITLGLIPFNINPHYLDPDPNSTHKGETRETRINEFHAFNDAPVLGLREGSWLEVNGDKISLKGNLTARLFKKSCKPSEIGPGLINHYFN